MNAEKSSAIVQFINGPEIVREPRRDPRAHDRVQPDAQRVVAAPRRPAQRDRAARRPLALALRPAPPRRERAARLAVALGRRRRVSRARSRSCAAALSPVVDDDDVAELLRRRPDAAVEVVEGAGHSVQGDKPLELAAIIESRSSRADGRGEPARGSAGCGSAIGYDVRVLEPSPPAVAREPFTDDPMARGDVAAGPHAGRAVRDRRRRRPHLGRARARRRATSLAVVRGARARSVGSAAARSCRPTRSSRTRLSLHALAEHVLCAARHRVNGKIGLRFTRGGFGTPFFGDRRAGARRRHDARVHRVHTGARDADRSDDARRRGVGRRDRAGRAAICSRRPRRSTSTGRSISTPRRSPCSAGGTGSRPRCSRSCAPTPRSNPSGRSAAVARADLARALRPRDRSRRRRRRARARTSAPRPATPCIPSRTSTSGRGTRRSWPTPADDPYWNESFGPSLPVRGPSTAPDARDAALAFFRDGRDRWRPRLTGRDRALALVSIRYACDANQDQGRRWADAGW